jgi:hypothetical protein
MYVCMYVCMYVLTYVAYVCKSKVQHEVCVCEIDARANVAFRLPAVDNRL